MYAKRLQDGLPFGIILVRVPQCGTSRDMRMPNGESSVTISDDPFDQYCQCCRSSPVYSLAFAGSPFLADDVELCLCREHANALHRTLTVALGLIDPDPSICALCHEQEPMDGSRHCEECDALVASIPPGFFLRETPDGAELVPVS